MRSTISKYQYILHIPEMMMMMLVYFVILFSFSIYIYLFYYTQKKVNKDKKYYK